VTVIAFTENFGYPMLIGDILVTARDSVADERPALPTAPEGVGVDGFPKVKLRKKLYVINERLAVGLAGELTEAVRFLQALRDRFRLTASEAGVGGFMSEYDFPTNGDLEVMVVLAEAAAEREMFRVFHFPPDVVEGATEFTGDLLTIGSGARSFFDSFSGMRTTARNPPVSHYEALERVMQGLAHLLFEETFNQQRVRDEGWGAGFEVMLFADGKFQKLPSATFAVWLREGSTFAPKRLVTYCYDSEGRLVLHALGANSVVPFVAIGIDEEGGYQINLEPPNFQADVMAHVYVAHVEGVGYPLTVVFKRSGDRVIIQVVEGKLQILHAQSFTEEVRRRLAAQVTAGRLRMREVGAGEP